MVYVDALRLSYASPTILPSVVKFLPWRYSIARFIPAAIGCNTYYVHHVSDIDHIAMLIWRIFDPFTKPEDRKFGNQPATK
ncbi:hypothetical protein TSUD_339720 [Trifolium subterraneum]|nr:hypothetical protein TSUD_339720 [Trifolium subterraneum]